MKGRILLIGLLAAAIVLSGCVEPPVGPQPQTYSTKEECEQVESCVCTYVSCDFVPEGKAFEEACGKDFEKGWKCMDSSGQSV